MTSSPLIFVKWYTLSWEFIDSGLFCPKFDKNSFILPPIPNGAKNVVKINFWENAI